MEIRLLKNHNGSKVGSVHDVAPEAANYLVRCNVAEYTDGINTSTTPVEPNAPAITKAPKQKKQVKPKLEKK